MSSVVVAWVVGVLLASSVACAQGVDSPMWTAFNDLHAGLYGQDWTGDENAAHVTGWDYGTLQGELVDIGDGAPVGVSMVGWTGRSDGGTCGDSGADCYDPTGNGVSFEAGTDAALTFGAIVDHQGVHELDAASWQNVIRLEGLDPTATYTIALTANRGARSYAGARFTRVTIAGADTYVNGSTPGVIVYGEDSVSLCTGENRDLGYVARWTDVSAADGRFEIVSEWDWTQGAGGRNTKGYSMAVFKLEAFGGAGGCKQHSECDDGDLCTDDLCTGAGACEHVANEAPCDDGVACTTDDHCVDGTCGGTPDHDRCDDGDVCTDNLCDSVGGCATPWNVAPCDDHVACTAGDTCYEGVCAGSDDCGPDAACDPDADECVGGTASTEMFVAYNDFGWASPQIGHNITTITSPAGGSGLPSTGELIDFSTGEGTGVTLTVDGGKFNGGDHAWQGGTMPTDSDAEAYFEGAVDLRGVVAYVNSPTNIVTLTLSNLAPEARYEIVLHADRAGYGWARTSLVTLEGADAFVNESSAADDNPDSTHGGALFGGPDDPSVRLPAGNFDGYVARFTEVAPGPTGTVVLRIVSDAGTGAKGKYVNALRLTATQPEGIDPEPECELDADCAPGEICYLQTTQCVVPLYVAPDGHDDWSGRLPTPNGAGDDGPFATVVAARDAIRALKAEQGLTESIAVLLREGTYTLTETLVLGPDDSGTQAHSITYGAYPGEAPVISGGRLIEGLAEHETEVGVLEATLPRVLAGETYFRQLFVNDRRVGQVRMPKTGFYLMDGPIALDGPASFHYQPGEIEPSWADSGDVEVVGLARWAEIRMPIASVDAETRTAELTGAAPTHNWNGYDGARYFVLNAPVPLAHDEWWLDRQTGVLQYSNVNDWYEEDGALRPPPVSAVAPEIEVLVELRGEPADGQYVRNLHLSGLTFRHTRAPKLDGGYADIQAAHDISGAVNLYATQHSSIRGCTFTQLGGYAIDIAQQCTNLRIADNEISSTGAGGIKMGRAGFGEDENPTTGSNRIEDNHIHDIGLIYPAAAGIWVAQTDHNRIAHNHIHDTYHSGISLGWIWGYGESGASYNIVEQNHIHHVGRNMLCDMGGIYTLGVQTGTTIRNNLIHDIDGYRYGGWGIYADEGTSEISIEHNVVYGTEGSGFHQHYGRENLIRNNIFAYGQTYQIMRTQPETHLSFTIERNIFLWSEGELLGSNWTGDQYQFDHNVYWYTDGTPSFSGLTFEAWQNRGQDASSIIADPRFVDPETGNFELQGDSPALTLGFEPIDVSQVGVRTP